MKQKLFKLAALATAYGAPLITTAQERALPQIGTTAAGLPGSVTSTYGLTNLVNLGNKGLNIAATVIIALSLLFIIYGGYLFASSGGDETKLKSAKTNIIYGVIGMAVIVLSGVVFSFVSNVLLGQ